MKPYKNLFLLSCFVLQYVFLIAQPASSKHVILIGIDGLSAEGLQYANTPIIDKLISQGVISLKTRGVMPTVSAPNWASILAGAGPEQHGTTSNNWSLSNHSIEPTTKDEDGYFPSIFTLIRKQLPKAVTAMFYDWDWLGTFVNRKYITKEQFVQGHVMITSIALNYWKKEKPLFTFIYYGHPDEVGHSKGFGTPAYFQSINDIDAEIGKIVDGVKEIGLGQNTTFIITSDHGGIGFGHGGESMIEIEVPWIITGPGIKKNTVLDSPNDLMNTSPTIAKILGIKTPTEWIGKAVNEVFSSKSSVAKPNQYVPKPWCSLAEGSFTGPQQIELTTTGTSTDIFYTLDGSVPGSGSKKFTSPFTINKNCTLKAICISKGNQSQIITRAFTFLQGVKSATLSIQPSPKYPGLGTSGLFDGLIGSSIHTNKQWMGFEGDDFEVTVDRGEVKPLNTLGIYVLQMPVSWIFLPTAVEYYASDDGITFKLLTTFYPAETDDIRLDGPVMLARNFDNINTRYIRIKATNIGTCPVTHP
ncbi:MAG: alkaline phosphatase family protein, partial [Bacteroidales bacterium]